MSDLRTLHVKSFLLVVIMVFCVVSIAWSNETEIDRYKSHAMSAPNNVNAQYNLGVAYYKSGEIEMSIKAFEKTLKLDPNNKKTLVALGQIYEGEGAERYKDRVALDKARVYYAKVLEKDPQDLYVRHLLAHVYLNQGKNREGIYQLILTGWRSIYGFVVEALVIIFCILGLFLRKNPMLQAKIFGCILVVSILSLTIPFLRPVTFSIGIPRGLAILISLAILVQQKQVKK